MPLKLTLCVLCLHQNASTKMLSVAQQQWNKNNETTGSGIKASMDNENAMKAPAAAITDGCIEADSRAAVAEGKRYRLALWAGWRRSAGKGRWRRICWLTCC